MGSLALTLLSFVGPALLRDGLKYGFGLLAANGIATGSTGQTIAGVVIAGLTSAYTAYRSTPNNLLARAAEHPDPIVAEIVKDAMVAAKAPEGPGLGANV